MYIYANMCSMFISPAGLAGRDGEAAHVLDQLLAT